MEEKSKISIKEVFNTFLNLLIHINNSSSTALILERTSLEFLSTKETWGLIMMLTL